MGLGGNVLATDFTDKKTNQLENQMKRMSIVCMVGTILLCGISSPLLLGQTMSSQSRPPATEWNGIQYSPSEILAGAIQAVDTKSGRKMYDRQIYVLKFETEKGLVSCVQVCPIVNLSITNGFLIVKNSQGYQYHMNLENLEIDSCSNPSVIDFSKMTYPY